MTDRYFALTVTLDHATRDDDAQPIIDAIKMIRGVQEVVPHVANVELHWAKETAVRELTKKLWSVLYPHPAMDDDHG
jgi:hypothetical protein